MTEVRTMAEVLQEHIDNCNDCQNVINLPPRKLGRRSLMCDAYQALVKSYADYEGMVMRGKDPDKINLIIPPVMDKRHVGGEL